MNDNGQTFYPKYINPKVHRCPTFPCTQNSVLDCIPKQRTTSFDTPEYSTMILGYAQVALWLFILSACSAQDRFVSEIPATEETALENIVEDEYVPPPAQRGGSGWESPVYSAIYSVPLPIPPVKQPKKYTIHLHIRTVRADAEPGPSRIQ